jgi:hypothetical protein
VFKRETVDKCYSKIQKKTHLAAGKAWRHADAQINIEIINGSTIAAGFSS